MYKFFTIFLFLTASSLIWGNNYYVDKDANGNNTGSSWLNAFRTISAGINAAHNGDIVYISGGSTSKTYPMQATIPAGKYGIVIKKGVDPNHNGKVIIDGQNSRSYGIYGKANYWLPIHDITISGIQFRNCRWAGIYFSGESSGGIQNILIDSCEFVDNHRSGVFIEGSSFTISICTNIVIKRCYFNAPNTYGSQSDLIFLQQLNDATVDHCVLIDDNTSLASSDLHDDNIQCHMVNNVTFSNNIAAKQNDKTKGTQMYFLEGGSGICQIYNNVAFNNSSNQEDATIRVKTRNSGTYIYNNSVYNAQDHCVATDDPTTIIENNIFYSAGTHYHTVMVEYASRTSGYSDYNLYYDPSHDFTNVTGGMGSNDEEANPYYLNLWDISNFNLSVNSGSPAIDAGTDLGSPYNNKDIMGISRPQGNGFDKGAYEFVLGNAIQVHNGWNYISIPSLSDNMSVDHILPTRISPVYSFGNSGYVPVDILENGKGYIVKFSSYQSIIIDGNSVNNPIQVYPGWNFIGPFDTNIPVSQIQSIPNNLFSSEFVGYNGTYFIPVEILISGKSYWIKCSNSGTIYLNQN